jgi:3-hydroxyacyl-CoA dehydrogenase
MSYQINKVGIIGAGTMGGGIAALIAGTGVPVVLLDVPAEGADRNKTVKALWERQRKSSPAALFTPEAANLVTLGNTEDDFDKLRECDWIIEVIVEQLAPKQQLMARLEARIFASISSARIFLTRRVTSSCWR